MGQIYDLWKKVPSLITPFVIGVAWTCLFTLYYSSTGPLLAWVSQAKTLQFQYSFIFELGQVTPLILAGATTENLKRFLELQNIVR